MQYEKESAIATLGWVARARARALKTYGDEAESWLAANGAPMRARQIYAKTAVAAGSTDSTDTGDYGVSSWADTSLQTQSAFFRMLADRAFFPAVFNKRVGITSTPVGSIVDEGAAVPLSPVALQTMMITPLKAASLVICTNELLEDISSGGQQAFNRGLVNAVATAVDAAFFDLITSTATTSNPASGALSGDAWSDLRTAMLAVSAIGSNVKLYVVCAVDVAVRLATLATTDGAQAFVAASPSGGEIGNLPLLVSGGLDPGSLFVVNAAAIAAAGGAIDVRESRQGAVSMLDNPTMSSSVPTEATMVSLWQSNLTGIMAVTTFGASVMSDTAVAEITSINWGGA